MARTKGHDPKCRELAAHFLADEAATEFDCARLAQHIQDEIEDWIEFQLPNSDITEDAP
jgi:hypothetical protein